MDFLVWLFGLVIVISVFLVLVVLLVRQRKGRVIEEINGQEEIEQHGEESNKREEAKQKGDEFEKYIMKRLSQNKYFVIKEVTADKGFDVGVWVEANAHPDFIVEFNWKEKGINKLFAVECKWRKDLFRDYFCWASLKQMQRYKEFSFERQIPVFLALGLGGDPADPDGLYIVPLREVLEDIKEFQKGHKQGAIYFKKLNNPKLNYLKLKDSGFFFDSETEVLR